MKRKMEKYNYIVQNYCESSNKMSLQELADDLEMSLGGLKNFMYRHKLNKKAYYTQRKEEMRDLYKKGVPVKHIAKIAGTTHQNIYYILNERRK